MELRVLRYFLMVAREENMTRAAELLHITQPTLSRQLKDLEDELGTILFDRKSHKLKLTREGFLLQRYAQEIVDLEDKTKAQFLSETDDFSGEIAFGMGDLASCDELMGYLKRFQEENPRVRYNFFSGTADDTKERLERGLLDFALLLEPVEIKSYEFIRMKTQENWAVIVPSSSPLASKSVVTAQDIKKERLILPNRGTIQNEMIQWLGAEENTFLIAAQNNLPYSSAAAVRNGIGVALSVSLGAEYEGTVKKPIFPELTHGSVLAWRRDTPHSKLIDVFIKFIKKNALTTLKSE